MFQNILVVCVGNICRSPMAEALLIEAYKAHNKTACIESAGIGALVGYPADPQALALMSERGIDISAHRARQLTPEMAMEFELILTMEQGHVRAVESMVPSIRGRVHRLGKWGEFDVPDPYRQSRQAFERALSLIDEGINDWGQKLW